MQKTSIEWVKNPDGSQGWTWNPITGCLNRTEEGLCLGGMFPCYAYGKAHGRLKSRYLANENLAGGYRLARGILREGAVPPNLDPFYPRVWPKRLSELEPIGGLVCELVYPPKTEKGIFACDMGDLFGPWIPREWQDAVFRLIKKWPAHRFYLLTKQTQELPRFSPFPENCWVGVTLTKPNEEALLYLDEVEAKVRFLSVEPMQAPWPEISFEELPVDWLIIGAQTKPYKPPKVEWVEEIVSAADKAGIPVFLKDNLYKAINDRLWDRVPVSMVVHGIDTLKLRQEMPKL